MEITTLYRNYVKMRFYFDHSHPNFNMDKGVSLPKHFDDKWRGVLTSVVKLYDDPKEFRLDYFSAITSENVSKFFLSYFKEEKRKVIHHRNTILKFQGNFYYHFDNILRRNRNLILNCISERNYSELMYHDEVHLLMSCAMDIVHPLPRSKVDDIITDEFFYKIKRSKRFLALDQERLEIIMRDRLFSR